MNRSGLATLLVSSWLTAVAVAAPADAPRIQKEYQLVMEKWSLETRAARTTEERDKLVHSRPNPASYATRMWAVIGSSLREDWTLEPAAWFLRITAGQTIVKPDGTSAPAFQEQAAAIRTAVETYHLDNPKLASICLAMATNPDTRTLALLEKVETGHPDPQVQGVAALGTAILLKPLGDNPDLLRKRLTLLRKSIIQSADAEIAGASVAKLAEDELYVIRYLSKGRVAPDLIGVDSARRPLRLSDHAGKVVILLFWGSNMPEADHSLDIAGRLHEKFRGRPFTLLGVNDDPVEKLRALQSDGSVAWPNFSDPQNKLSAEYRVGSWPLVYVLDGERKIQYAGQLGAFVDLTVEALLADLKTPASE